MTLYYRTTDQRVIDLDPVLVAQQAASKRAILRLWVAVSAPVVVGKVAEPAPPVITATDATQAWSLRDKTQAELDADTAVAEKTTLKAALAIFDARTATNAQIQRAIAWLIRQQG